MNAFDLFDLEYHEISGLHNVFCAGGHLILRHGTDKVMLRNRMATEWRASLCWHRMSEGEVDPSVDRSI